MDPSSAGKTAEAGAGDTRQLVERESHYLWGSRYLLSVKEEEAKPSVHLSHRIITLTVRPRSSGAKRATIMHEWHKSLLHDAVLELIRRWEPRLEVEVAGASLPAEWTAPSWL
jgi:YgjP-like, metallopeptidase domain